MAAAAGETEVKPLLKMLMSVDLFDIEQGGVPENPESFAILVEALVGEEGPAADTFAVVVLTPDRVAAQLGDRAALSGRGLLLMPRYDYAVLRATIQGWVDRCEAPTWEEAAALLCRHMTWEFDVP